MHKTLRAIKMKSQLLIVGLLCFFTGCQTTKAPVQGLTASINYCLNNPKEGSKGSSLLKNFEGYSEANINAVQIEGLLKLLEKTSVEPKVKQSAAKVLAAANNPVALDRLQALLKQQPNTPDGNAVANDLAGTIISLSGREDCFYFCLEQLNSRHLPVRYGSLDIILNYFLGEQDSEKFSAIKESVIERIRGEKVPAVADVGCQIIGSLARTRDASPDFIEDILGTLDTIHNSPSRPWDDKAKFRGIAKLKGENVMRTAGEQAYLIRDLRSGG